MDADLNMTKDNMYESLRATCLAINLRIEIAALLKLLLQCIM